MTFTGTIPLLFLDIISTPSYMQALTFLLLTIVSLVMWWYFHHHKAAHVFDKWLNLNSLLVVLFALVTICSFSCGEERPSFETTEYDGHQFIIYKGNSMLHHPGCSCRRPFNYQRTDSISQ